MIDHGLNAVVFPDVEIPGVAGRVTASFGRILHLDQPSRPGADRQFLHAFVSHRRTGIPIGMEREQKPIIIVYESWFDFVLHLVGLAAELGTVVGDLNRLAVLILPFIRDLASLGLPLPDVSSFE